MKITFTFPLFLLIICCSLSGCTVNRYYYVAEDPVELYEFPSFSGKPILIAAVGDTLSATNTRTIQLGGPVPVEYKGYQFYSPSARARFIRIVKVNSKKYAAIPAVAYVARVKQKAKDDQAKRIADQTQQYWAGQDTIQWYGQVSYRTYLLRESFAISDTLLIIPANTVVKIKRHNYNYWQAWMDGKVGYIPAFSVHYFSKSNTPFSRTAYTGRTYHPDGEDYHQTRTNTPTTGAAIHTGPRGGRYYINSNGNKTYIPRSSSNGGRGRR